MGLLTSLDSASSAVSADRRRRLTAGDSSSGTNSMSSMIDTLGLFSDLMSSAMGLGQIEGRFCINVQKNTTSSTAMIDNDVLQ
jgi:hypothetical protein